MTHVDLFSGIGGFALAARWAGFKTVQFVEIDAFCRKVLQKNFVGVPIHDDIKTFQYTGERPFILTGGFPCQPYSCAGKRRGKEDDRALWPEMLRVVSEAKPDWVIGENVGGFINMGLDDCISDLENQGYEVQAFIIPACAVNAPHRRDRVWIVGYSECPERRPHDERGRCFEQGEHGQWETASGPSESDCITQDTCRSGCNQGRSSMPGQESRGVFPCEPDRDASDTDRFNGDNTGFSSSEVSQLKKAEIFGSKSFADTSNEGLQGRQWDGSYEQSQAAHGSITERNHSWDEPWLEAATRLCRVDDGLPRKVDRVNRLKSLGNAIVPQVAYEIMAGIFAIEKERRDAEHAD